MCRVWKDLKIYYSTICVFLFVTILNVVNLFTMFGVKIKNPFVFTLLKGFMIEILFNAV